MDVLIFLIIFGGIFIAAIYGNPVAIIILAIFIFGFVWNYFKNKEGE